MSRITKRDLILSLEDAGRTPAEIARALETTEAYVRAVEDAEQTRTIPPDPAIYRDLLDALKVLVPLAELRTIPHEHVAGIGNACAIARAAIARADGER